MLSLKKFLISPPFSEAFFCMCSYCPDLYSSSVSPGSTSINILCDISELRLSTLFNFLCICLVLTPTSLSSSLLASSSLFWAYSKTSLNFPNSVLTAPRTSQTSPLLFCMANVLKPICKLFNKAAIVLGPAMFTR